MSPDSNDEYFADGLTEEMIASLSGLSGVGVIARTSVMHYKDSKKTVREIAKDLGVGSVLEGSVRKAGNKIRIMVQLIDGKNEEHLWAQRFDRDLNDIFAVQSEIAESVARALELKLVPKDIRAKPSSASLDAYTLCLEARFLWNRRTKEGIEQAITLFREALKLDPDSARAYAGLADCYWIAADWRFMDRDQGKRGLWSSQRRHLNWTTPYQMPTLRWA
jgi:adenylate cyclase